MYCVVFHKILILHRICRLRKVPVVSVRKRLGRPSVQHRRRNEDSRWRGRGKRGKNRQRKRKRMQRDKRDCKENWKRKEGEKRNRGGENEVLLDAILLLQIGIM